MTRKPLPSDTEAPSLAGRLRDWDPAKGQSLPAADEGRMRARMISALDEGARDETAGEDSLRAAGSLWWAAPAFRPLPLAVAALVLVAIAGSVWLLGRSTLGSGGSVDDGSVDVEVTAQADPLSEPPIAEEVLDTRPATTAVSELPESRPLTADAATVITERPSPAPEIRLAATPTSLTPQVSANTAEPRGERPARQLAMQARGGTKIYWTLDPEFLDDFAESDDFAVGDD